MSSVKRLSVAAVGVALLALVLAAAPAHAQRFRVPGTGGTLNPYNYYDPYGTSRQAAFNISLYGRAMSQVPPYALGYNPYPQIVNSTPYYPPTPYYGAGTLVNNAAYASPGYGGSPGYGDTGGYGSPYTPYTPYYDPTSSFLQAAASVIDADGKFKIHNQQANVLREQVRSAHIDNNRKAFDEFMYERANRPTWLDDLERQKKLNLRYALSSASGSEILEGISLNTILDSLKQMPSPSGKGEELSPDLLQQINVTAGGGANPGLLKSERLMWPSGLSGTRFTPVREEIDRNLQLAISDAEHKQKDNARLKNLRDAVTRMSEDLDTPEQISQMTPSQYIEAQKYLSLVEKAVSVLEGPNAADYVNNKYVAKGKTVGDLVKNMSGLRFAPATPGSEKAYRELYDKLAAYYRGAEKSQPSTRGE